MGWGCERNHTQYCFNATLFAICITVLLVPLLTGHILQNKKETSWYATGIS